MYSALLATRHNGFPVEEGGEARVCCAIFCVVCFLVCCAERCATGRCCALGAALARAAAGADLTVLFFAPTATRYRRSQASSCARSCWCCSSPERTSRRGRPPVRPAETRCTVSRSQTAAKRETGRSTYPLNILPDGFFSGLLNILSLRPFLQSSPTPEVGRRPWGFRELPSGLDFAKLVSTRGFHVKARGTVLDRR